MDRKNLIIQSGIVIISALLFIPFLGKVHLFDWDEINFAESAREMIVTGDYLTVRIFFEPFWEKPPLFIWMQVISMKLFGINEFAARFPNAVCGIFTLLILFNLGKKLYDFRFGSLWVLAYAGSFLSFFYFRSGIIDPWFNLFIFTSITCWVYALRSKKSGYKYALTTLSAFMLGLAILTKGPVALIVFGLVVLVVFVRDRFILTLNWKHVLTFCIFLAITGGLWFILEILSGHADTVREFFTYQVRLFRTKDAGHGGFPLYHFIILLFGVFPASIFAIQGHRYYGERDVRHTYHASMTALLWVVLILFSVVKTKIVHYSSLTYFPITYLAAFAAYQIIEGNFSYRLWQKILLGTVGGILSLTVIGLPVIIKYKELLIEKGLVTHSFTIGNLQADPGWTLSYSTIGIILMIGVGAAILAFRGNNIKRIITLYYCSLVFTYLSITFFTPGAEKISQNAAIEFIKGKAGKDAYLHSFYKSYAVLFYGKQGIPSNPNARSTKWLTSKNADKDVYFIMRIDKKPAIMKRYPNLEILYEKNGYVFAMNRISNTKNP